MNWGHKIGIAYGAFVVLMITMVIMCIKQTDVNLVTENYYEDEIGFEKVIQKKKNTAEIKTDLTVATNEVNIFIDPTTMNKPKGTVVFYRPSNPRLDFELPLNLNGEGKQTINTSTTTKGLWEIKISWSQNNIDYYLEEKIQI